MIKRFLSLTITEALMVLTLISFAFWSLPILPGTFKPLISYLLVGWGLVFIYWQFIKLQKFSATDTLLAVFVTLSILLSILGYRTLPTTTVGFVNGVVLFSFGILGYFGYRFIFSRLTFDDAIRLFAISGFIFIALTWLNALSMLGVLPGEVRSLLDTALSGKSSSRLVSTGGEPDWLSRICLFYVVIYGYMKSKYDSKLYLFAFYSCILFFGLTFSLSGVIVLMATLGLYTLYKLKSIPFKYHIYASIVIVCVVGAVYNYYQDKKAEGDLPYYLARIDKVLVFYQEGRIPSFQDIVTLDGSVFIRVAYPVISFQVFIDYPFGIGVGQYGAIFPEYAIKYGDLVYGENQIFKHIQEKNADQRTYIGKILTETGLVGTLFLVAFYVFVWRLIGRARVDNNQKVLMQILFFMMLANAIQFASYIFPLYWLVPALIIETYKKSHS